MVQTILHFSDIIGRPIARWLGVPAIISSIQARNVHVPKLLLFLDRLTTRWADLFISVGQQAIPFAITNEGVPPIKLSILPTASSLICKIAARLGPPSVFN